MFHEWIIHLNLGLHFLSVESKELKIEIRHNEIYSSAFLVVSQN